MFIVGFEFKCSSCSSFFLVFDLFLLKKHLYFFFSFDFFFQLKSLFWFSFEQKCGFAKHSPKKNSFNFFLNLFVAYGPILIKKCIFIYIKGEKCFFNMVLDKYLCWFSFASFGIYTTFVKFYKDLANISIILKILIHEN